MRCDKVDLVTVGGTHATCQAVVKDLSRHPIGVTNIDRGDNLRNLLTEQCNKWHSLATS